MKAKKKGKIIESSQVHEKDTGSADVQIALLSERINAMLSHLKKHAKDLQSKRGLLAMVMKRKKLLAYLKKENEDLRRTNAEIMLQLSRLREYGIVNEELKGLLDLKDSSKFPLIPATIISKSISKSQGTITINAGLNQGVKAGMPVITDKGLVGIIYTTADNYSIARTLHNVDLKITVKSERTRENAVMKWNGDWLVMTNVPKTYNLKKGDRIVTSDISSSIPFPLPVGLVYEVGNVQQGIFNEKMIQEYVSAFRKGDRFHDKRIWALVFFQMWYEEYVA